MIPVRCFSPTAPPPQSCCLLPLGAATGFAARIPLLTAAFAKPARRPCAVQPVEQPLLLAFAAPAAQHSNPARSERLPAGTMLSASARVPSFLSLYCMTCKPPRAQVASYLLQYYW